MLESDAAFSTQLVAWLRDLAMAGAAAHYGGGRQPAAAAGHDSWELDADSMLPDSSGSAHPHPQQQQQAPPGVQHSHSLASGLQSKGAAAGPAGGGGGGGGGGGAPLGQRQPSRLQQTSTAQDTMAAGGALLLLTRASAGCTVLRCFLWDLQH